MSDMNKITMVIQSGDMYAHIQKEFTDGTVESCSTEISELAQAFHNAVPSKFVSIGKLPEGFKDLRIDVNNPGTFEIDLTTPSGVYVVNYMGKEMKIPFPKLFFTVRVAHSQITKASVWAINKSGQMCHYPFGNVYTDGHICWGGYRFPKVANAFQTGIVPRQFFSLGTNNDLWSEQRIVPKTDKDNILSQFYKRLRTLAEFPDECLKTLI